MNKIDKVNEYEAAYWIEWEVFWRCMLYELVWNTINKARSKVVVLTCYSNSMGKIRGYHTQMYDSSESPSAKFFANVVLLGDMKVGKSSMLAILAGQRKQPKQITYKHCPMTLTTTLNIRNRIVQLKVRDTGGELFCFHSNQWHS